MYSRRDNIEIMSNSTEYVLVLTEVFTKYTRVDPTSDQRAFTYTLNKIFVIKYQIN